MLTLVSLIIRRRRIGEMSLPACTGTVVRRPSGWANCLWEPRCRISAKPSPSNARITSRGLRTGRRGNLRGDRLDPYELGFELGLSVFQKHRDDLSEILGELIQTAGLRVRTGEPRNVAHEQACLEILLDYGGELPHWIDALSLECRGTPARDDQRIIHATHRRVTPLPAAPPTTGPGTRRPSARGPEAPHLAEHREAF